MLETYTAKYTKISYGYMGQVVEWPEVVTEGKTLEECREMLQDALQEMILAYRQQNKEIPLIKDRQKREKLSISILSESSLAKDWLRPEENEAWRDL